ncbi:hypothetical protein [Paenibacillus sp. YSY-4.3]
MDTEENPSPAIATTEATKITPQQQERFEITSGKYHAVPQPKDGNEKAERSLQGALTSNIFHHIISSAIQRIQILKKDHRSGLYAVITH